MKEKESKMVDFLQIGQFIVRQTSTFCDS